MTDAEMARRLGTQRARIAHWKSQREAIPEHYAIALAEMAGADPGEVLLKIKAEMADPRSRPVWAKLAARFAACVLVMA